MPVFRTVLAATGGNNVGIVVPDEVLASFGAGTRVPVVVTIDGGYTYRTTVGTMRGVHLVPFNAQTRAATGRGAGDDVEVVLEHDRAPHVVEIPEDLAAELAADLAAAAAWERLAPSVRKEHARAITEAKAAETRARRLARTLETLRGD